MTGSAEEKFLEYDLREQAHKHEMEKEKQQLISQVDREKWRTRSARQETYKTVGTAVCVAAVIVAICYFIYQGTRPAPGELNDKQIEQQREQTCMDHGGTWIPSGVLTGEDPMCVLPGQKVTP